MRLSHPHDQQLPTLLGELSTEDGAMQRYLGYADGVYVQTVLGDTAGALEPHTTWSRWAATPEAAAIAAGLRLNLVEDC